MPSTSELPLTWSSPWTWRTVNATFFPSGETRGRYGPEKPLPPPRPSHVATGCPIGRPACEKR